MNGNLSAQSGLPLQKSLKRRTKDLVRSFLGKKYANTAAIMKEFSGLRTERIPSVDLILVLMFYRFGFFRNAFLKSKRETITPEAAKSGITSFQFSENELKRLESDGISSVFNLSPPTIQKIISALDSEYIQINGQKVHRTVDSFLNDREANRELHELQHYQDLNRNQQLLEIATDPGLLRFMSRYLRSESLELDITAFWSFPNRIAVDQQGPDMYGNAQRYHFDHANRRCAKLFVYLKDCEMEDGPHCYVRKSHREKPLGLQVTQLNLTAKELECYFKKDDRWLTLTGKAGDCFITDPFGMHRGLEPSTGSRLLLQFMYSVGQFQRANFAVHLKVPEFLCQAKPL